MSDTITLSIDDQEVEAEDGELLIRVIRQAGIDVPSLCYYEHIDPPLGTCRVCTVLVNGCPTASCTTLAREGMSVVVHSAELQETRKAMIEMLFAEGNHFCPACEKSGDCDLQGIGYRLGVSVSRYPHLFVDRRVDYNPKRMVIEPNRCIRCRRCVEEVRTDRGYRVFAFVHRGTATEVAIDYEQEATLSEEQAVRAMHLCPTGAILVRGRSLARPYGERKYDVQGPAPALGLPVLPSPAKAREAGAKRVIATVSLAGCFGCHMSLLDIDTGLLDLLEVVEFNRSPLTDFKVFTKPVDVGVVEGGCCNSENVEVLREFRRHCDVLVAVGECAIWGGLPAMRNTVPLRECLEETYLHSVTSEGAASTIPRHEEIPKILDRVYACNEIVDIDYCIPGCPPSAQHIWKVLRSILFGEGYSVLLPEFKYD
jgi:[NiFe] hydrogenase diaphorase moiety small subunit